VGARSRQLATGAVAAAALAAVVVLLVSGGGGGHRLFVDVPDASGALAGQRIRMAGQSVGRVASVRPLDRGRAARLELKLDDSAWPLPRGTTMQLRWGGTISYIKRYVAVVRGPANRPTYPDGATLPTAAFTTPVEFDSAINELTPTVRRDLRALIERGGAALAVAQP
jgi:ABC-type transporter Mla subunit MlaD